MRIAYISADRGVPVIGRSGSSRHVREIVTAFLAHGMEVTLLTACPPELAARTALPYRTIDLAGDPILQDLRIRTAEELRSSGQEAVRASETYALLLNQTLLQQLTDLRGAIDVVYERQSLWSFAGLQFARQEGLPFLLEVNAPLAAQQQEYRTLDMVETARAVESLLFAKADRVLVTCSGLRDYARTRGAAHVRIIPCGVSDDLFIDRERRAKPEAFVLGFVGSLKPWHGVELLLRAFARLCERSPVYRLLVVGDGPLRTEVEEFCQRRQLEERVTMAGAVEHTDIPAYLATMDVGLAPYPPLPSFYFSPLKVWEYAAAGVPIVASASGDLPRLFPHRSAALLHPPGSVKKIVEHVESLRHNPELGSRLARRARQVARRHTWNRLALRIESLATHLLQTRARRAPR